MRRIAVTLLVAGAMMAPAHAASAQEEPTWEEIPTEDLASVEGLTAEQLEAIESFNDKSPVTVPGTDTDTSEGLMAMASGSRRATYYRGSALMWTRDNVDFGYDWSRVTWTSPFQQAGYIFPNIARNRGITKYQDTTKNDRFRALNTIGAGVVTPWGDVQVYSADFVHRLSVNHDGAWSAWSD